jgi:hypothetical protein
MELTSLVQKFRLSRSRAEAASPKWVKAGLGSPRWHLQDIVFGDQSARRIIEGNRAAGRHEQRGRQVLPRHAGVFAEFETNLRREPQLEGIAKAEGVYKAGRLRSTRCGYAK